MNAVTGDLAFIPLGGTGEIGMNLNVYRCDDALLAVDCGLGFAGADNPEVDVMVPDPTWLVEHRDRLVRQEQARRPSDRVHQPILQWSHLASPRGAANTGTAWLNDDTSPANGPRDQGRTAPRCATRPARCLTRVSRTTSSSAAATRSTRAGTARR